MSVIAADLDIRKSTNFDVIENTTTPAAPIARGEEDDDEDETVTTEEIIIDSSEYKNNKNIKITNDSNNNNSENNTDQPQIIQTDEIITVVVNENSGNCQIFRENQTSSPSESAQQIASNDKNFPKSILQTNSDSNDRKTILRKKSVSFEKSEEIKKFIVGEEIIDKINPFRSNSDEISDKYRIVKKSSIPTIKSSNYSNGNAINIPAPLASEENDFITKEEILRQSKYVPVYIKNPDKVLTYDRSVLEKLKSPIEKPQQPQQKIPVPLPRKSSSNNSKAPVNSKKIDKKSKRSKLRNPKYPDLADIKVKIGTDIDESLYDPNEVVLNAKKFDSRFKKLQFGSTDDLEEIVDKEETVKPSTEEEAPVEEKKSYTNTVNSEEFRQYLKKKGLVLFPIKSNGTTEQTSSSAKSNGSAVIENNKTKNLTQIDETDSDMEERNGKKKSVFSRLSSIFSSSKGKTMPKANEPLSRLSYSSGIGNGSAIKNDNNHLGTNIKRVILERNYNNGDNRSVSANSEFMQHFSTLDMQSRHRSSDEDNKSSISSVLTAAADDDVLDTPIILRKMTNGGPMLYRNIDVNKSKLYQTKVKQNNNGSEIQPQYSTMNNGEEIIKPKVQRPLNISRTAQQQTTKSLIKPPVPLRRSIERQSMPILKSGERYKPIAAERRISNGGETPDKNISIPNKNTSTPTNGDNSHVNLISPKMSPITNAQQKSSEIDPITYAKIHEIKKKTDEVLLNKSSQLYVRPKMQNNFNLQQNFNTNQNNYLQQHNNLQQQRNFIRNSPQRSTITDIYQNRIQENNQRRHNECGLTPNGSIENGARQSLRAAEQPQRSQSVLDNMTQNKNSLYGEVKYRRPDGTNVNVIMRRPESSTMDRNQIMNKIYEYYRKSVNNTPIPFGEQQQQKNLQYKSQSTDTSPVSYASLNTMRSTLPKIPQQQVLGYVQKAPSSSQYSDYSIDRKGFYYSRPSTLSSTPSAKSADITTRNHTISETDSVFLPSNENQLRSNDVLKMQQYNARERRQLFPEPERIYDVVYSGSSTTSTRKGSASDNASGFGSQKIIQRPASALGGSMIYQPNRNVAAGRMTPLILQTPNQFTIAQGDIIINNQIYRPISTIPTLTPNKQQTKAQPIYSSPMRRRQSSNNNHNNYESDSEAGEIQSIMGKKYGE